MLYVGIYSGISCLVFVIFAEPLVTLYTDDSDVIARGIQVSRLLGLTILSDGFGQALSILFRSLGHERPLLYMAIVAAFIFGTPA